MPNVQSLPNWLLLLSLAISALYGLFSVAAHIAWKSPKVTAFFVRGGAYLGKAETLIAKLTPPPPPPAGGAS